MKSRLQCSRPRVMWLFPPFTIGLRERQGTDVQRRERKTVERGIAM